MDSGLYAAYTGLMTRMQSLELTANNIANAGTAGYRAQRETFAGVLAGLADTPASQAGDAANAYGILGGAHLSALQGTLSATGNPLDLALNGSGYFAVQTAQGTRYTRDGAFTRSDAGLLVSAQGAPVLDAGGNTISLPPGTVHVGNDGAISVTTAGGDAIAGTVGVFDLGAAAQTAEGANLYLAAAGTTPKAIAASVKQGALEGSNADPMQTTAQLLTLQRQAEMMQRAVSVFANDFDKTATEELPRV